MGRCPPYINRGCLLMRRRAFTLIEMLVVMGIIAILAACLLPAFLDAAGAARRISCVNNLKQINLAIHGYLTAHNVLPSGSYDAGGPIASTPDAQAASWIVSLLALHGADVAVSCV